MLGRIVLLAGVLLGLGVSGELWGDEWLGEGDGPSADVLRSAVERAIPLLEAGMRGSAEERTCFTCHNQAVPIFALSEAQQRGFAIDAENFARQVQHTHAHLERGREGYSQGRGQGGQVVTAGYALWALDASGRQPDETTSAVTHYLLDHQTAMNHWEHRGSRPPSSGSDFTATYVALRGLADFGTAEQQAAIEARRATVRDWLVDTPPQDTEDRVFRLRSLAYYDDPELLRQAADDLVARQRDDGGWAQLDDLASDAYATGTVLVALIRYGEVDREVIRRGLSYLLDTQLKDGSWHVVTRAKPFQAYFESGFPHGADQFISMAATGWATLALTLSLPERP
jgi:N-acyl-D-amino-acid deacylase